MTRSLKARKQGELTHPKHTWLHRGNSAFIRCLHATTTLARAGAEHSSCSIRADGGRQEGAVGVRQDLGEISPSGTRTTRTRSCSVCCSVAGFIMTSRQSTRTRAITRSGTSGGSALVRELRCSRNSRFTPRSSSILNGTIRSMSGLPIFTCNGRRILDGC